ncbi:MAG: DNA mismatch repair protein MutS [Limisphaerales bacterium]
MADDPQLTPMMTQYRRIKSELPTDALLLFRLGDFYEMFFEDAQLGAQLLNISLTKRGVVPMCGIPFHAANNYITRILRAGKKVAICEQVEEARPGQLVKREVTQILSPGTHFDERLLVAEKNNFLAALCVHGKTFGLALIDLTTGDFKTSEMEGGAALRAELERLRPAEIIFPGECVSSRELLKTISSICNGYDDWVFVPETAQFTIRDHLKVASLDGFGLKNRSAAIGAAGAALHYLTQHLRRDIAHLTRISFYQSTDFLALDVTSLRNLEILEPLNRDAPRTACLYGALNRTATPMGARRLRDWLTQPLAAVEPIQQRQEVVQLWIENSSALENFRQQLVSIRDLERTIGRLSVGSGNGRDLIALKIALEQIPKLQEILLQLSRAMQCRETVSPGLLVCEETPKDFSPVSHNEFGPVFDQFRGRGQAAIEWLSRLQKGEALGALFHPAVGEIDLIWGEEGETAGRGFGLAKIKKFHPEVLPNLEKIIGDLTLAFANFNSIILESEKYRAAIRLNWKGNPKRWLLTAFEKNDPSQAERTIDVSSAAAEPQTAGTTQLPPQKDGPEQSLELREEFVNATDLLSQLQNQIMALPHLVELISSAIVEEPPLAIKEGGLIRAGFDAALDELHQATRGGKDWIAKLQQDEIERTGIASLKVRFNSVFGYYIEITKSNLDKVPAHYTRKQTIANGERCITPELKEMEGKILGAEERSVKLEYELFQRVREEVLGQLPQIQQSASALSQLDVLASFAETARLFNYCRPQIRDEGILQIREGRHPVLDQALSEERFVPNDTALRSLESKVLGLESTNSATSDSRLKTQDFPQLALITGPNMAGKSTFIRQVALLTLMAHTGSFIPAAAARIDLVDRIFTRIGASDDLSRGQSTFMVEMSETANILNNATARSLIILDEIGRGTSTFDGLSLAWSIVEFLHNQVGAKTLFATHYHELTGLAGRLPRVKNFNVAVREWNDQIVFLRKIVEGGTDKSYGIQVARLAGVPKNVLERAKEILRNLEDSELTPEGKVRQTSRHRAEREKLKTLAPPPQMDLFG